MSKGERTAVAALGLTLLGWALSCAAPDGEPDRSSVEVTADGVVRALARADFEAVAAFVHPRDGVRLSPYAFVDPSSHRVLSAERVAAAASAGEVLDWGLFDGSGKPIRLPIADYWSRFVYDVDFAHGGEVTYDRWRGYGNSLDNSREVYPEARCVDYFVAGSAPDRGGFDWRSLRLVLRPYEGEWFLVAIIHDEWTV